VIVEALRCKSSVGLMSHSTGICPHAGKAYTPVREVWMQLHIRGVPVESVGRVGPDKPHMTNAPEAGIDRADSRYDHDERNLR
jgi:hypothetical protein